MLQGANTQVLVKLTEQDIGDAEKTWLVSAGFVMERMTESRRLTEYSICKFRLGTKPEATISLLTLGLAQKLGAK